MTEQQQETERDQAMLDDQSSTDRSDPDPEPAGMPAEADPATAQSEDERPAGVDEERAPLLASTDAEGFRRRWEDLQAGFVDQPREMVEQANELVGELMQQLSAGFSEKRGELEAQWEKGEDVSTEDLRVALTRYRSFFNRLLSA
jgi:hypothetical protein